MTITEPTGTVPGTTGAAPTVDTDPHPFFRVYSAGNFGEVAPQRLSPMSWSLVGDPMERATRSLARRLWGRCAWAEGSHYVFVGYFGCRPYHNLSSYCHLSRTIPGLTARDVTAAYFEDVEPPEEIGALREPRLRRATGAVRLLRELREMGPRLRALEENVSQLEWDLRAALTTGSPLAMYGVLKDTLPVLEEAWGVHILSTSGLVPLRSVQHRIYRRMVRHPEETAQWLNRPRELVWDRLHRAAATEDPYGPGNFLDSSFYEVADSHAPWRDYAVRHRAGSLDEGAADALVGPAEALASMLPKWRAHTVQAVSTTVGEVMAGREHSKSLAMRTLHLFRRLLPRLAGHQGVADDMWPYLTVREFTDLVTRPELAARAEGRVETCRAALAVPMPEHLDLTADDGSRRMWAPDAPRTSRGVAPGSGFGQVMSPDEDPPDGPAIIVCSSADADIAPLLPFAEGVLSERGSELSHIAILAREYRIPCVVGYPGAASLPSGTTVSINGTTGEVTIHDHE
ncbi:PEP-utilizing enzyme [Streptomyces sp. NPDC001770]